MRRLLTNRRLRGELDAARRRVRQQDHLISVAVRYNAALAALLAEETSRNRLLADDLTAAQRRIDDLTTRTEAGSTTP